MKSFGELIVESGVRVADLADWCCVSRECVYRYIRGDVRPSRMPFGVITDFATYLQRDPFDVYNACVESFESVHGCEEN